MEQLGPQALPGLSELPGYGKTRPSDDSIVYRLSSNESPFPPLPVVAEAMASASAGAHLYPPLYQSELIDLIATHYEVDADAVMVGGGSIALIEQLTRTFAGRGDEVIYGWRSYEAYPIIVSAAGATPVEVPLRDSRLDADALLRHITASTKMLIICNPNNPTGTVLSPSDLDSLISQIPPSCLVVIDEAYGEFVPEGWTRNGVELVQSHSNVVVLRTFSKAYGLAGARVGYAIGAPAIIEATSRIGLPFTVSAPALAGACAAMRASAEIDDRVQQIMSEAGRLFEVFDSAGVPAVRSAANFIWLPLGEKSAAFTELCAAAGVGVRCFPGEGVRVTVGSPKATDAVKEIVAQFR